ncbi:FAM63B-like [Achlya hypogyna]|uniref:FAM63B-like n=1 Tax=Achlya hypogyna TaxID=1202772 RepID=A0A1V9YIF2_ACHHY|nr:FAM63B-like [Achlya hypogyna]
MQAETADRAPDTSASESSRPEVPATATRTREPSSPEAVPEEEAPEACSDLHPPLAQIAEETLSLRVTENDGTSTTAPGPAPTDKTPVMPSVAAAMAAPAAEPTNQSSPRTSPRSSPRTKPDVVYWVKATKFLQRDVLYICQNVNGPCPLLAICNVLLLRGHLSIDAYLHPTHGGQGYIYARDVIALVQQRIMETNAHFSEAEKATVQEVVDLIPSLDVGLDVNVQFHAVDAFEYTSALAIFDLLAIRLVHGWVVDPQDIETASVLQHKSYNHLIETVIDHHSVGDDTTAAATTMVKERSLSMDLALEKVEQVKRDGPVIERFLADSASQLTYAGLVLLHEEGIKERELAVFFRNNHFSSIFKINGALYLLATDAGYYDEPSVIWERLDEIDGDSEYFTSAFTPVVAKDTRQQALLQTKPAPPPLEAGSCLHPSADYQMALRLQEEENKHAKGPPPPPTSPVRRLPPPPPAELPTALEESVAAGDPLALTEDELRLQREAEAYYKAQQVRAQRQAVATEDLRRQQVRRESGSPAYRRGNGNDQNGCIVM